MLVQFVADTLFKTLVAVPIVGGLVLVALVVGGNPFDLLRLDDLTQTVSTMVGVLLAQPVALAAFVVAMGVILTGGSILMFAIKAGSVTVLLAGDRSAGTIEVPPLRLSPRCARPIRPRSNALPPACGSLFARYLRLGIALTVAYALIAAAYIAFLFGSTNSGARQPDRGDAGIAVGADRHHAGELHLPAAADRHGGRGLHACSRRCRTSRACCAGARRR